MEFTSLEIMDWRKKIYEEIQKLPHHCHQPYYACLPETKDFEKVKSVILPKIAFRIWEKLEKPKNCDIDIWYNAEELWNFLRYMW